MKQSIETLNSQQCSTLLSWCRVEDGGVRIRKLKLGEILKGKTRVTREYYHFRSIRGCNDSHEENMFPSRARTGMPIYILSITTSYIIGFMGKALVPDKSSEIILV